MQTPEDLSARVEAWRRLIVDPGLAWVLFAHGTCVVLRDAGDDPAAAAARLLESEGPVRAGTPSADFSVVPVDVVPGWVVTCHHPDLLVHVAPDDVGGDGADEIDIGLLGRDRRARDAAAPEVAHVELPGT